MVEKKTVNISVSPYCTPVVFEKRKYQVFSSGFGRGPLQLPDQLPYDWPESRPSNTTNTTADIYLLEESGN